MRHRTAHLSPVPSRSLEIHAGEEKGGNSGGGATRARSWASGESCVGGSGGERGDGSDEHGGVFELVPAESAPCLLGVNPLQLPPSRVGWTKAYRRVHTWAFALWGARLTFCGFSGAYSCLCCCLTGGSLHALRLFTVAIWYVALRVHVGREGRDGVVDEGGEGWCGRAGGKEYQTHRAAAPPHPVPLP